MSKILKNDNHIVGTLSVCMIVRNEEALLGRCLQSVKSAADEIVVVDTGSNDSTIEVAKSFGAKIVEVQWKNDFARARNISLKSATSKWILWLDADDIVPQESIPGLLELKSRSADCVFAMVVRNERPSNTGTEFMQARMFPNHPDIFFERSIHEQMMPSALRLGLKLENTKIVIEHHGYADPFILKQKARRNVEMLLKEFEKNGGDEVMQVEIADSFFLIEDYESACRWYNNVLSIPDCQQLTPAIAAEAFCGLGNIHLKKESFQESADYFKEALKLSPWRLDVFYNQAVALELTGDIKGAVECLLHAINENARPGQVGVDFRAAKIKSFLRITRLLIESGDVPFAEQLITRAAAMFPTRQEIKNMAGKIFLKSNRLMDALHEFEKSLLIIKDGNIDAYIGLCLIYIIAGQKDLVIQTLKSIEPLFRNNLKYNTFKQYMEDNRESDINNEFYSQYLQQLQKEFFQVF